MKFVAPRRFLRKFSGEDVKYGKEHVEVIYEHIRHYLNHNEKYTIADQYESPEVYCVLYDRDQYNDNLVNTPRLAYAVITNLEETTREDSEKIVRKSLIDSGTLANYFRSVVIPLFREYQIECAYGPEENTLEQTLERGSYSKI